MGKAERIVRAWIDDIPGNPPSDVAGGHRLFNAALAEVRDEGRRWKRLLEIAEAVRDESKERAKNARREAFEEAVLICRGKAERLERAAAVGASHCAEAISRALADKTPPEPPKWSPGTCEECGRGAACEC